MANERPFKSKFRYTLRNENGRVLAMCLVLAGIEKTAASLSWAGNLWVYERNVVIQKWALGVLKVGELDEPEPLEVRVGRMRCGVCGEVLKLEDVCGELRWNWHDWVDVLVTVPCLLPRCVCCKGVEVSGDWGVILDDALEGSLLLSGDIVAGRAVAGWGVRRCDRLVKGGERGKYTSLGEVRDENKD